MRSSLQCRNVACIITNDEYWQVEKMEIREKVICGREGFELHGW